MGGFDGARAKKFLTIYRVKRYVILAEKSALRCMAYWFKSFICKDLGSVCHN
jgi:hypothetical protein